MVRGIYSMCDPVRHVEHSETSPKVGMCYARDNVAWSTDDGRALFTTS